MKRILNSIGLKSLGIFTLSIWGANVFAISGDFFDFHAYLRSGTGSNNKGGDQVCFNNPGNPTPNEFRLGNECTDYSELTFVAHNLKPKNEKEQFWKTQFLFMYESLGNDSSEATYNNFANQPTNGTIVAMREAFIEGKNVFGHNFTYWVGKRFYRDADSLIDDWYYFADMSGTGAGIGNMDTGFGKLSLATINRSKGSNIDTKISVYYPQIRVYDARLFEIPLWKSANLNLWAAHAQSVGGTSTDGTTKYDNTNGNAFGARYRQNMFGGFNDFSILFGEKLLTRTDLWGNFPVTSYNTQNNSKKILLIDNMAAKITDELQFHMTLAYEDKDPGLASKKKQTWKSVGVRPIYFFSDKFSVATELGHSIVKHPEEKNDRTLTKVTVAGQLHPNMGIWVRPVLRMYATSFNWSDSNNEAGSLWAIKSDQPYNTDKNSAFMVGFQGEVWF